MTDERLKRIGKRDINVSDNHRIRFEKSLTVIWNVRTYMDKLKGIKAYLFALEDFDLTDCEEYEDAKFIEELVYAIKDLQ